MALFRCEDIFMKQKAFSRQTELEVQRESTEKVDIWTQFQYLEPLWTLGAQLFYQTILPSVEAFGLSTAFKSKAAN